MCSTAAGRAGARALPSRARAMAPKPAEMAAEAATTGSEPPLVVWVAQEMRAAGDEKARAVTCCGYVGCVELGPCAPERMFLFDCGILEVGHGYIGRQRSG